VFNGIKLLKKFNPLLQSKVKRIVIKRLNKLIQVKTFFLHKKTNSMEETWKSLIENFKDVAIKEMKIVLTSKKNQRFKKNYFKRCC